MLPQEYCGFLGDDFWFILVLCYAWFDIGYMHGVGICVDFLLLHLYLAVCSVLLPEECVRGFFWETTSGGFPYSSLVSFRRPGDFHAFLREGGPRMPILRSTARGDTTGAVLGQGYDVFYACPVEKTSRSKMNVSFTFRGDEALEKKFYVEAQWVKFFTLAGHRSVDGCRASLYNGLRLERSRGAVFIHEVLPDAGFTGDDTSRAAH